MKKEGKSSEPTRLRVHRLASQWLVAVIPLYPKPLMGHHAHVDGDSSDRQGQLPDDGARLC